MDRGAIVDLKYSLEAAQTAYDHVLNILEWCDVDREEHSEDDLLEHIRFSANVIANCLGGING